MVETLHTMLIETWATLRAALTDFLPRFLIAALILLVGVVVGRILRALTLRSFFALHLDRASDRLGLSSLLARGDVRHTVAEIAATFVYWLVLLLALQMLGWALGLDAIASFFGQVLNYLPRLVAAIVILLVGAAIGSFVGGAVHLTAANAGVPVAPTLGRLVKYVMVFFALALALEQLQISSRLLTTTFLIVVGAASLGVALAFGIGCRDIARDVVVGWMTGRRLPPGPGEGDAAKPDAP